MILVILRVLFVLLMAAVGWSYLQRTSLVPEEYNWMSMAVALVIGTFIVCVDILSPRKKLLIFSGTFLGLIVGIALAYGLSFVVQLFMDQYQPSATVLASSDLQKQFTESKENMRTFINILMGICTCYLSISFILQTRDDWRFVIPYTEFTKQRKGPRPILLDTSVLIDGRIADIAATGILESQLIVPRFILQELQNVADAADKLKRNRGRRGLDVLHKLQTAGKPEVILYESSAHEEEGVTPDADQQLLALAKEINARVLTNDFNLNKVAQLRGVAVININDLATALKPVVLPGEKMHVRVQKAGEEPGQGVGYLDDGTMVVVEQGRQHLNEEIEFIVTSFIQTSAGKMIFGKVSDASPGAPRRGTKPRTDPPAPPAPPAT